MIGRRVGSYRITAKIGEGGMGAVYRAEDVMLQRRVAIKVLRPELARQPQVIERFRTEAVALARLSHPNIAAVFGLIEQDNSLYMVMEFIEGETLEHLLGRTGRLAAERAVRVCRDVLDALEHAHSMGVIHRDLKPANLMISRSGLVKVMDFGIARLAGTSRHTEYGRVIGTPLYMSPEQLRGEEVDPRSDVYSLGIVLYELLTGREAFQADSDYEMLMAQLSRVPTRPMALLPDLPPDLDDVVMRALSKARSDRFTSAATFRGALAPFDMPTTRSMARISGESAVAGPPQPHRPVALPEPAVPTPPPTRVAGLDSPPPTRLATPTSGAPPTRVSIGEGVVFNGSGGRALGWLERYLPFGWPRLAVIAAFVLIVAVAMREVIGGSTPAAVSPRPEPLEILSETGADEPPAPEVRSPVAGGGAALVTSPDDRGGPVPEPVPVELPSNTSPPGSSRPRPSPPPALPPGPSPSPSSPPAAVPPPAPPSAAPAAVGNQAYLTGAARIATLLQARNTADLDATYLRASDADHRNWEALSRVIQRVPARLEGVTVVRHLPSGTEAELSATLQWRTAFGSNRRVPVRLIIRLDVSSGDWLLQGWRFVGQPDLG